jgi:hypothetical protein
MYPSLTTAISASPRTHDDLSNTLRAAAELIGS